MKFLMIAFALFATTTATAKNRGVLEFKIKKATFADSHVQNAGSGTLVLNYDKSLVNLTVQRRFSCPAGRMCAQVMPAPMVVELPVVSVTKDSCGVLTVTAREDGRPVDGILEEIVVKDPSRMTCRMYVEPSAVYRTAYYDRMSGKAVSDESKMVLAFAFNGVESTFETSLAPAILVEFKKSSGFTPVPKTQTLYVDVIGRVINNVQNHRTGEVVVKDVAQLSSEAFQSLKLKVEAIDTAAKLVDLNEGQPQCTDAPTSSVVVHTAAGETVISRYVGCHTFEVQDGLAAQVRKIMQGLAALAQ